MFELIGQRIRRLRKERGISVEAFSMVLGISCSMINYVEQGSRYPSYDLMKRMASTLNVPVEFIQAADQRRITVLAKKMAESHPEMMSIVLRLHSEEKLAQILQPYADGKPMPAHLSKEELEPLKVLEMVLPRSILPSRLA